MLFITLTKLNATVWTQEHLEAGSSSLQRDQNSLESLQTASDEKIKIIFEKKKKKGSHLSFTYNLARLQSLLF